MIGCLCIHGFTGGPYEVEPLATYLREKTDWIIKVVTLPGHGQPLQLQGIYYQDWINAAEKELKALLHTCEDVYVIGFSMGGLIAGYLAANYPVKKIVFLSASAYYVNFKQMLIDIKGCAKDFLDGKIEENILYQRYKKKAIDTPIESTFQFRRLVKNVKPALKHVTSPALIIQGESDGIVPVKSAKYIHQVIPSPEKEVFYIPEADHLICHCDNRDLVFEKVESFLKQ